MVISRLSVWKEKRLHIEVVQTTQGLYGGCHVFEIFRANENTQERDLCEPETQGGEEATEIVFPS